MIELHVFISKLSDSDVYTHSVFASVTLCMQIAIMPHLSFPVFLFNDIRWAYLDVCLAGVMHSKYFMIYVHIEA